MRRAHRCRTRAIRHHFDIDPKAIGLSLATASAITAYLFRSDVGDAPRTILATFMMLLSVGAVVGGLISRTWVRDLERVFNDASAGTHVLAFPFNGAQRTVALLTTLCGLVGFAALAYLTFGR